MTITDVSTPYDKTYGMLRYELPRCRVTIQRMPQDAHVTDKGVQSLDVMTKQERVIYFRALADHLEAK
jgi:hypothetical protein